MQKEMMEVTNLSGKEGSLADAFVGADIFRRRFRSGNRNRGNGCLNEPRRYFVCHGKSGTEIMPDLAKRPVQKWLEPDVPISQIRSTM